MSGHGTKAKCQLPTAMSGLEVKADIQRTFRVFPLVTQSGTMTEARSCTFSGTQITDPSLGQSRSLEAFCQSGKILWSAEHRDLFPETGNTQSRLKLTQA